MSADPSPFAIYGHAERMALDAMVHDLDVVIEYATHLRTVATLGGDNTVGMEFAGRVLWARTKSAMGSLADVMKRRAE